MYDSGTVVTSSPQVLHDYCFLIVALEAVNMRWLTSSSLKRLLVLYTCFQASGLVELPQSVVNMSHNGHLYATKETNLKKNPCRDTIPNTKHCCNQSIYHLIFIPSTLASMTVRCSRFIYYPCIT